MNWVSFDSEMLSFQIPETESWFPVWLSVSLPNSQRVVYKSFVEWAMLFSSIQLDHLSVDQISYQTPVLTIVFSVSSYLWLCILIAKIC